MFLIFFVEVKCLSFEAEEITEILLSTIILLKLFIKYPIISLRGKSPPLNLTKLYCHIYNIHSIGTLLTSLKKYFGIYNSVT